MFQRILIPVDLAQKNQPALAAAAEIARQNKATGASDSTFRSVKRCMIGK